MHLVENWQRPAKDDVNPDELEYLFNGRKRTSYWDSVATAEQEPVARISPAYIRLQTKVEVLKGALELTSEQLQEAHRRIGALAAELARRDDQIKRLNADNAQPPLPPRNLALSRRRNASYAVAQKQVIDASNYQPGAPRAFGFPDLALNFLLVIGFAITVLLTIL